MTAMEQENSSTAVSRVVAKPTYDWKNGALARLVRTKLRDVELRPTRQRVSLASLLFVAGDRHVTVDQLFAEAKALRMPLSRATVYNTLHQFVAAGLVREIALYGSKSGTTPRPARIAISSTKTTLCCSTCRSTSLLN